MPTYREKALAKSSIPHVESPTYNHLHGIAKSRIDQSTNRLAHALGQLLRRKRQQRGQRNNSQEVQQEHIRVIPAPMPRQDPQKDKREEISSVAATEGSLHDAPGRLGQRTRRRGQFVRSRLRRRRAGHFLLARRFVAARILQRQLLTRLELRHEIRQAVRVDPWGFSEAGCGGVHDGRQENEILKHARLESL